MLNIKRNTPKEITNANSIDTNVNDKSPKCVWTESAPSFLPPANEVWGKVIFLHLFVILFTGEGYLTRYTPWCRHPPRADTPSGPGTPPGIRYTPGADTPLGVDTPPRTRYTPTPGADTPQDQVHPPGTRYTTPRSRHPPRDQVHPSSADTGRHGQRTGGPHPTGMQSAPSFYILVLAIGIIYFILIWQKLHFTPRFTWLHCLCQCADMLINL